MDLGLKGLNALVTGGSKGIGRRCADIFAAEGANVAICARNAAEVDEAVAGFKAKGVKGFGQAVDVADKAALEAWVGASRRRAGRHRHPGRQRLGARRRGQRGGLAQAVRGGHDAHGARRERVAALPREESRRRPSSSSPACRAARSTSPGPAYGAFKAALIHYAQGLAYKLAGKMIRVNSVSPGNTYFDGGIWQYIEKNLPDLFKQALSLNPTGRMATAEEVARGVVFLASPASSFTTGTNLVIDGALTKGVQF